MKTLIIALACSFTFVQAVESQTNKKEKMYDLKSNVVKIETDYLDVNIQTWKNDYIALEYDIKINLGGNDDVHKFAIENTRNGVELISSIDTEAIDKMVIMTDKEGNKTYTPIDSWDENMKGRSFGSLNFGYEINGSLTLFVPENTALKINSIYGDVIINGAYQQINTHSTYGLIEAKLGEVSSMREVRLESTYDIVDLTLGNNSDVSLSLQTSYGSVFTDLPLKNKSSGNHKSGHGCSQFSEKYVLNDGSVAIDIVATYDNIYVRSK